jgi:uncharacterized protein YdaT
MPWNHDHYPRAMNHLAPVVRDKAIAIANALLAEGYPDGQAIRIAIAQTKQWAEHHIGIYSGP